MEVGQPDNDMIIAVIQARMTSSRLPAKVMLPLPFPDGTPLIGLLISKLLESKQVNKVVVATPSGPDQEPLIRYLQDKKIDFFQGDEDDVLSRFLMVTSLYMPAHVIRVTADNPFIDLPILGKTIEQHQSNDVDYTYTVGLPYGMNMEIIKASSLMKLGNFLDLTKEEKEHVTLRMLKDPTFNSFEFKPLAETDYKYIRVTVDTPFDYMRAALLCRAQQLNQEKSDLAFILEAFKKYPFLFSKELIP